eukprot:jgi/Mesen1/5438/ME000270S04605
MAAITSAFVACPALTSQKLASGKNGINGAVETFSSVKMVAPKRQLGAISASGAPAYVPDMNKRNTVNLLLLGAIGLPTLGALGPYVYFFVPPGSGSGSAGVVAKDALGNDVTEKGWKATHGANDRALAQGLKGDPTYLVVADGELVNYGINAVCTHLGCVVPWNAAENQFQCPCHGSRYNFQGKVVRGPAPLSLALAHADIADGKVVFSPWTETDFRTGENPWWA